MVSRSLTFFVGASLLCGCASTSGLVRLPNNYLAPLPLADTVLFDAAAADGTNIVPLEVGFFRVEYVLRGKRYSYTTKPWLLDSLCARIDLNGDHVLTHGEYAAFDAMQDALWQDRYRR